MNIRTAASANATAVASIYALIMKDICISFELEPPFLEEMRDRIKTTLPTLPWQLRESCEPATPRPFPDTDRV